MSIVLERALFGVATQLDMLPTAIDDHRWFRVR